MPSKARLNRLARQLTPKHKGPTWTWLRYPNPWWRPDGGEVIIGPEGDADAVPDGAKQIRIEFTAEWRPRAKPQEWSVKATVNVDLPDAVLPSQQINEDGSVIVPVPEPEVRAPTSWIVVKPSAHELAAYAGAMDWYSAGDRREHSEQTARDMVRPVLSDKLPEGVIAGPFDDKAAALSSAYERLAGLHAGFVDDRE